MKKMLQFFRSSLAQISIFFFRGTTNIKTQHVLSYNCVYFFNLYIFLKIRREKNAL